MKAKLTLLFVLFLMVSMVLINCQTWEDFGKYKVLSMAPRDMKILGPSIKGEDCNFFSLMFGFPETSKALEQMMASAPDGTTGIQNLKIEMTSGPLQYVCVTTTGLPVGPKQE